MILKKDNEYGWYFVVHTLIPLFIERSIGVEFNSSQDKVEVESDKLYDYLMHYQADFPKEFAPFRRQWAKTCYLEHRSKVLAEKARIAKEEHDKALAEINELFEI